MERRGNIFLRFLRVVFKVQLFSVNTFPNQLKSVRRGSQCDSVLHERKINKQLMDGLRLTSYILLINQDVYTFQYSFDNFIVYFLYLEYLLIGIKRKGGRKSVKSYRGLPDVVISNLSLSRKETRFPLLLYSIKLAAGHHEHLAISKKKVLFSDLLQWLSQSSFTLGISCILNYPNEVESVQDGDWSL